MKIIVRFCLFGLLMLPGFFKSCVNNVYKFNDYEAWLNNPENKLVIARRLNGMEVKVKYLPAEYLAAKEATQLQTNSPIALDKLLLKYKKSEVFMITLKRLSADSAFQDKAVCLAAKYNNDNKVNLACKKYAKILLESGEVLPIQTQYEISNDTPKEISMYCVFDKSKLSKEQKLDLIFTNGITQSQDNHFLFNQKDFRNRPVLL